MSAGRDGRYWLAAAAPLGFSEGGAMRAMFAVSCPERVSHLVLFGAFISYADLYRSADPERIKSRTHEVVGYRRPDRARHGQQGSRPRRGSAFAKFERCRPAPEQ